MAYCTPEDAAYLLERGFKLSKDGQQFSRGADEHADAILPCWEGKKHMNDLVVPPGDRVFWQAVRVFADSDKLLQLVVGLDDQQATPISAYVTAEIREWKRQF